MFPAEGETLFGSKFFTGFGGKAPNQAVMCKRLGDTHTKVSFIGKLGNDENGRAYRENFEQSGVDVKFVGTASEGIPRYYDTCNVLRSRSYCNTFVVKIRLLHIYILTNILAVLHQSGSTAIGERI